MQSQRKSLIGQRTTLRVVVDFITTDGITTISTHFAKRVVSDSCCYFRGRYWYQLGHIPRISRCRCVCQWWGGDGAASNMGLNQICCWHTQGKSPAYLRTISGDRAHFLKHHLIHEWNDPWMKWNGWIFKSRSVPLKKPRFRELRNISGTDSSWKLL